MTKNKQKLIALVSALEEENIIDYCYTFIGLKVYGKAALPKKITNDLRKMWEEHTSRTEQDKPELTDEEKQAGAYRADLVRLIYNINNVAILNCILIFVEDIAKEDESIEPIDEQKELIAEINKEVASVRNIEVIRFILNVIKSFKKNRKWGC